MGGYAAHNFSPLRPSCPGSTPTAPSRLQARRHRRYEASMPQLDYQKLDATPVAEEPYRHVVVPQFVLPSALPDVVAGLPKLEKGGSFPTTGLRLGAAAQALMEELEGERFRSAVARRF